jgi:hypothetical protein
MTLDISIPAGKLSLHSNHFIKLSSVDEFVILFHVANVFSVVLNALQDSSVAHDNIHLHPSQSLT